MRDTRDDVRVFAIQESSAARKNISSLLGLVQRLSMQQNAAAAGTISLAALPF